MFLAIVFLFAWGSEARAQYMFLDADGDGRNGFNDQLPRSGWSEIEIWLDTTKNRDGSTSFAGGTERQGIAAYELLVQVRALSVEWGRFIPAQTSMRVVQGPLTDSRAFYVRVECGRIIKPGKHKLGKIRFNPDWGQGAVNILPCAVLQDTVGTSFQGKLGGPRFRLGPTVSFTPNPIVVGGDWHDADGVSFSSGPRPSAGPVRVESGLLYLGWNRLEPPFELRIIRGRAAVNGLTLPERSKPKHRVEIPNSSKAQYSADVFGYAVGRMLHDLGLPDSVVLPAIATAYRYVPAVDSVRLGTRGIEWFARGNKTGRPYGTQLIPWETRSPPPRPESLMVGILNDWARVLRAGHLLRIEHLGSTTTVPGTDGRDLDHAIRFLQRGGALSAADTAALLGFAPLSDWGAVAHPVRLEKISP
jgi:hypothetical protein